MIFSLWSKAFISDEKYKGKRALNQRTTRLLAFSLAIVEFMMIYYIIYGNIIFLKAATAATSLWIIAFLYVILTGKIFLHNKFISA